MGRRGLALSYGPGAAEDSEAQGAGSQPPAPWNKDVKENMGSHSFAEEPL